ncbi:MAG: iron-sulfur cluster assembly accessory protein [Dehalococcoidia bacterium]|nr:iron-sulfur cluster assembly accessory protein [Dehalococcoidia bacterium]
MVSASKPAIPANTIFITEKAASKVKEYAARDSMEQFGLKVAVKGGGCSGLEYVLDIVEGPTADDKVIEHHGLELYVPKMSYVYLAGTELDFSDGLNGKGFVFKNPNATRTCGCGDSFSA